MEADPNLLSAARGWEAIARAEAEARTVYVKVIMDLKEDIRNGESGDREMEAATDKWFRALDRLLYLALRKVATTATSA